MTEGVPIHPRRSARPPAAIVVDGALTITGCTPAAAALLGFDRAELVGRALEELLPSADRSSHRRHLEALLGGPDAVTGLRVVVVCVRKDGAEVEVEASISLDVTSDLRGLRVGLRPLAEPLSGDMAPVLAQVEELLGRSLDWDGTLRGVGEVCVPGMADCCVLCVKKAGEAEAHTGDVQVDRAPALAAAARRDGPLAAQALLSRASGLVCPLQLDCAADVEPARPHAELIRALRGLGVRAALLLPVTGGHALLLGRVDAAFDDLTAIALVARRLGIALERARAREEADASAEAMKQLVTSVSHDLANLLEPIRLSAVLLAREARDGDRRRNRRPIQVIDRVSRKMTRLLLDLLDAEAVDRGKLSLRLDAHEIAEVIDDACLTVEPQLAAKHVRLEHRTDDGVGRVRCDAVRVGQVLFNLLSNAVRHTPPGGRIGVHARRDGAGVEIAVTDSGPGIDPGVQARLFRRFEKGEGGQHGLGLFIARTLVEAHRGRIWVNSSPGEGATFVFNLPGDA